MPATACCVRPAHLVFVTKNRRPVFTDAMLTFAEHTMRTVARTSSNQRRNRPRPPIDGQPAHSGDLRLGAATKGPHLLTRRGVHPPGAAFGPACVDTPGRRPTSPSPAQARLYQSSSNTPTDKPAGDERRASPRQRQDGRTRTKVRGCADPVAETPGAPHTWRLNHDGALGTRRGAGSLRRPRSRPACAARLSGGGVLRQRPNRSS